MLWRLNLWFWVKATFLFEEYTSFMDIYLDMASQFQLE